MNPDLQPLDLRPLRDIHDSLGNPWWPLAPGWWLILALIIGLMALVWSYRSGRRLVLPAIPLLHIGDWRWDARRELQRLRHAGQDESLKVRLAELSELLKRIAMARHGRRTCADLHGQAWLDWLSEQDPAGFDWRSHGQLLIRAPYAPAVALGLGTVPPLAQHSSASRPERGQNASTGEELEQQLAQLMAATERWITAPRKSPKRPPESAQGQTVQPAGSRLKGTLVKLTKAYHKLAATTFRPRKPPAENSR
ncbi:MAG: hypothetical protein C1943_08775 [Halochromatium sp.]|nr:hypothetical protein [Halochromatium sp.]